jgi:hypothetical protein
MLFEFTLFFILGLVEFVPLAGNGKLVAMIVFIVLMVLWAVVGFTGYQLPFPAHR